ncbi:MAG: pilus assembly protein [Thermoguttaceae bacterium]|nr:pilus assembly protein [Thermoguttaceae bacterium]MDW8078417.1 pilus assembly protein [Thermoguttaceae bacterium]
MSDRRHALLSASFWHVHTRVGFRPAIFGCIAPDRPGLLCARNPLDGPAGNPTKVLVKRGRSDGGQPSHFRRTGAAVVEFAIVAPVFFLFVIGIIEFGRMVMVQQVITNASREGARIAVLDGSTGQEVRARAQAILVPAGVRNAQIIIEPDPPSSAAAGAPVSVTVSVRFRDVSWLPTPIFLGNITLQATTVMRRETI